jgi:hypothetical protein
MQMKRSCVLTVAIVIAGAVAQSNAQQSPSKSSKPSFQFADVPYFHRWSKGQQHEFTPAGQEDLAKRSDMVTVNIYSSARDGDALAAQANAVLENYKKHNARVLRTDSLPRTADRPAEHFIAVVFGRPEFIEVAFARFRLADGAGSSVIYSHRIYGEKGGDKASEWLKANGPKLEQTLMSWSTMPSPASRGSQAL